MITLEQFQTIIPNNKNASDWYDALNNIIPKYEINTDQRVAAFLAQCIHESNQFLTLQENLNYSAESLRKVWPSHFQTDDIAEQYARNPEKIANRAYANRMGNGDEDSGDGWSFAGKGAIQLTGRSNYQGFANVCGKDIILLPDYILTPEGSIESACYFWTINKLNGVADTGDIDKVSEIVNGGKIGMAERHSIYTDILSLSQV